MSQLEGTCPVHCRELFSDYSQLLPGGKVGLVSADFCLCKRKTAQAKHNILATLKLDGGEQFLLCNKKTL